jgi:hypothetical protein
MIKASKQACEGGSQNGPKSKPFCLPLTAETPVWVDAWTIAEFWSLQVSGRALFLRIEGR